MKSRAIWISAAIAAVAGIACTELAIHSIIFRDKLGNLFGRGHLLALVQARGIYQVDVDRTLRESDYASDIERSGAADVERRSALNKLIVNVAAQSDAFSEKISGTQHDVDLLRYQFPNEKTWRQVLSVGNLSGATVSRMLRDNLRTRRWIFGLQSSASRFRSSPACSRCLRGRPRSAVIRSAATAERPI